MKNTLKSSFRASTIIFAAVNLNYFYWQTDSISIIFKLIAYGFLVYSVNEFIKGWKNERN